MFWNKKPKLAPVAKYRIISKEVSFDCYLQKTLIYMKDGTKHRLIVRGCSGQHSSSKRVCLVTGRDFNMYKGGTIIEATLRTVESYPISSYSIDRGMGQYYHNGSFTTFQDSKGNTISVQSADIERIVQKPPVVYKAETFQIDELEEIK